jgi:hypothetical protein
VNLPTAPTDNLYKLASIAGLALMVFSGVYTWTGRSEAWRRLIELEGEKNATDVEVTYLESDIAQLATRLGVDTRQLMVNDKHFAADCAVDPKLRRRPALGCAEAARLKERVKRVRLMVTRLQTQAAKMRNIASELRYLTWFAVTGVVLGAGLAGFGLSFWYTRLQRHQDRIIEIQAATRGTQE